MTQKLQVVAERVAEMKNAKVLDDASVKAYSDIALRFDHCCYQRIQERSGTTEPRLFSTSSNY